MVIPQAGDNLPPRPAILLPEPYAKGGPAKKTHISSNPDTMRMELEERRLGVGGFLGKAVKGAQKGVLPAAEREANLAKMLEESKVKDRLYHATPKDFSKFKPGGDNPKRSGSAVWLSNRADEQPAAHNIRQVPDKPGYMYGSSSGMFTPGTNVMPVYVQARNPMVLDDPVMLDWAQSAFANGSKEFPYLLPKEVVDQIKKDGYDSIILADPYKRGDSHEVIMFEPEKIKSAIGNRGTYDLTDPDTNKAEGGAISADDLTIEERPL
jgi:hypothetical protein